MAEMIEANGHAVDVQQFRQQLLEWGRHHFRAFPWRQTTDPYKILMAEVMLHRTQAIQVVPVYNQFIARYPDIEAVAQASPEELSVVLAPLGLHWRIALIATMATDITKRFGGAIPQKKTDLLLLPGVSEYIASAVRCFAWDLPDSIIDTNTVRVIGRLFGLEIKDSSRRNRQFRQLSEALLDPDHPRMYNYALLDLADRICTKKRAPDYDRCPVLSLCLTGLTAPHS